MQLAALATAVVMINLDMVKQPAGYLQMKVEQAGFEQLIKAWLALDYFAYLAKVGVTGNIRAFRDYIHHVIRTKYPTLHDPAGLAPVKRI